MARKNLKVSEIVHEELEVRKHRDESFDAVLRRELGIIPTSVDKLTTYYPDQLRDSAAFLAKLFRDDDLYHELVTDHEEYFALNFDSKDSQRTIVQLRFKNEPPWIDIYYRNEKGELENAGQVLQQEGEEHVIVDVEFRRPDTGEPIDETGAPHDLEDILSNGLQSLQEAAYERWG